MCLCESNERRSARGTTDESIVENKNKKSKATAWQCRSIAVPATLPALIGRSVCVDKRTAGAGRVEKERLISGSEYCPATKPSTTLEFTQNTDPPHSRFQFRTRRSRGGCGRNPSHPCRGEEHIKETEKLRNGSANSEGRGPALTALSHRRGQSQQACSCEWAARSPETRWLPEKGKEKNGKRKNRKGKRSGCARSFCGCAR